jgi:hypothetical protein
MKNLGALILIIVVIALGVLAMRHPSAHPEVAALRKDLQHTLTGFWAIPVEVDAQPSGTGSWALRVAHAGVAVPHWSEPLAQFVATRHTAVKISGWDFRVDGKPLAPLDLNDGAQQRAELLRRGAQANLDNAMGARQCLILVQVEKGVSQAEIPSAYGVVRRRRDSSEGAPHPLAPSQESARAVPRRPSEKENSVEAKRAFAPSVTYKVSAKLVLMPSCAAERAAQIARASLNMGLAEQLSIFVLQ